MEKEISEKFTKFETQMSNLQKDLEIKNTQITALETKIQKAEKENQALKKHHEKKIKDLENSYNHITKKEKKSDTKIHSDASIKCDNCDFITTSRQGLKIHNSRVHSKINFETFPAACDICEKVFENENSMRKHKKREHSYHTVKYQCNECEFMANEAETLNVHFGKHHSNKKQFGLCDKI